MPNITYPEKLILLVYICASITKYNRLHFHSYLRDYRIIWPARCWISPFRFPWYLIPFPIFSQNTQALIRPCIQLKVLHIHVYKFTLFHAQNSITAKHICWCQLLSLTFRLKHSKRMCKWADEALTDIREQGTHHPPADVSHASPFTRQPAPRRDAYAACFGFSVSQIALLGIT